MFIGDFYDYDKILIINPKSQMIKGAAYQAIKLGLMLIQSCRGERLGTALALNTLLVIWLPIVRISLQRKHECESINSTSFALMIRLTLIKHINS